jgi:N-acetylglucosamine-6-phosphate deacetylase
MGARLYKLYGTITGIGHLFRMVGGTTNHGEKVAMLIHGGAVYTPEGVIPDGAILIDGAHIRVIGTRAEVFNHPSRGDTTRTEINAGGGIIAPGFIDLQVNGAGGKLLSEEPTVESVRVISEVLPRFGCTAYLPTIVTSSTSRTIEALQAVERARTRRHDGARVLGAHVEGPFINPERRGVHLRELIRPPSIEELRCFLSEGSSHITVLTLAPEMPGASELIVEARRLGIAVSIGHSNASYEQVAHAAGLGATMATHLFNAMAPLGSREPGTVGAVMRLDDLSAGLIADAVHVHPASLAIAARTKGRDGIFLVSDAMSPIGTDMTEFRLNGRRVLVVKGQCRTEEGTLAGSVLTMDAAVRTMHQLAGVPLEDAIRMATLNPARAIGIANSKGSLETGKDADVAVLSPDLTVRATVVEGAVLYTAPGSE